MLAAGLKLIKSSKIAGYKPSRLAEARGSRTHLGPQGSPTWFCRPDAPPGVDPPPWLDCGRHGAPAAPRHLFKGRSGINTPAQHGGVRMADIESMMKRFSSQAYKLMSFSRRLRRHGQGIWLWGWRRAGPHRPSAQTPSRVFHPQNSTPLPGPPKPDYIDKRRPSAEANNRGRPARPATPTINPKTTCADRA